MIINGKFIEFYQYKSGELNFYVVGTIHNYKKLSEDYVALKFV